MRFYESEFPDTGDIVYVKTIGVSKSKDIFYAILLEYNCLEGLIKVSDMTRKTRSKTHTIVGKEYPARVESVEDGKITLSRVSIEENEASRHITHYNTCRRILDLGNAIYTFLEQINEIKEIHTHIQIHKEGVMEKTIWNWYKKKSYEDNSNDLCLDEDDYTEIIDNIPELLSKVFPDYIINSFNDFIRTRTKKSCLTIYSDILVRVTTRNGTAKIKSLLYSGDFPKATIQIIAPPVYRLIMKGDSRESLVLEMKKYEEKILSFNSQTVSTAIKVSCETLKKQRVSTKSLSSIEVKKWVEKETNNLRCRSEISMPIRLIGDLQC